MTDAAISEIHARALITSALLQRNVVDGLTSADAFRGPKGAQLKEMVDAVLDEVVRPRPTTRSAWVTAGAAFGDI